MIKIKKHAIKRYQERVENVPRRVAEKRLQEIAQKGTFALTRQNAKNPKETEYKITYNGIELLAAKSGDILYIITCHGTEALRKWSRAQVIKRMNIARMVM